MANTGWLKLSASRKWRMSSALNSRTGAGQIASLQRSGNDLGTAIGLPTIAATACYWSKARGTPMDCAASAQTYALNHYLPALAAGDRLPAEKRAAVERQMSGITGLPANHFEKNGLALTKDAYRRLALASEDRLLGVYDSRYAARVDPAADKGLAGRVDHHHANAGTIGQVGKRIAHPRALSR